MTKKEINNLMWLERHYLYFEPLASIKLETSSKRVLCMHRRLFLPTKIVVHAIYSWRSRTKSTADYLLIWLFKLVLSWRGMIRRRFLFFLFHRKLWTKKPMDTIERWPFCVVKILFKHDRRLFVGFGFETLIPSAGVQFLAHTIHDPSPVSCYIRLVKHLSLIS